MNINTTKTKEQKQKERLAAEAIEEQKDKAISEAQKALVAEAAQRNKDFNDAQKAKADEKE